MLRWLIRDRDRIFGAVVTRRLRAMGVRDKPIAPSSPWQNAFAERLIGSIRRECVDHIIVWGEEHLRRILRSYARYYNEIRTLYASLVVPCGPQGWANHGVFHFPVRCDIFATTGFHVLQ